MYLNWSEGKRTLDDDDKQWLEKKQYVEEMALSFDEVLRILPRMAGRVLGWLLICEPPHQSMNDLVDVLQASKSSISTATRLLIQHDMIERISLPGERRDYFRVNARAWLRLPRQRLAQMTHMRQMVARGLELLGDESPSRKERLEIIHEMYTFFEQGWVELIKHWEMNCQERWREKRE